MKDTIQELEKLMVRNDIFKEEILIGNDVIFFISSWNVYEYKMHEMFCVSP